MRVLSVAYPLAPAGLDSAGGAEQVLAYIDRELVRSGQRSIVIAQEGSRVEGDLIAVPAPAGTLNPETHEAAVQRTAEAIRSVLAQEPVDVVHMHGIDFHRYLPPAGVPVLVTLHLPCAWYPPSIFDAARPKTWLHCVSQSQQDRCPGSESMLPPISNGIPLDLFRPSDQKSDFAVTLGRICPEKGIHHALKAAAYAGIPLAVAGEVFPYPDHEAYFREQIAPQLDGVRAHWIGSVGVKVKRELLARARCALIPSEAPETSSLVAMEAMASGTPVIAFRSGALPEIVQQGETGYLVESAGEMAEAIVASAELSPKRCREYAEAHFNVRDMFSRYEETYRTLVSCARRVADSVEVLRDAEALRSVREEWDRLFRRCNQSAPFLHPAWQLAWWDLFGNGDLHAVTVRRRGELAALAVLFAHEGRLMFSGSGISDRLDILAEDAEAADSLMEALRVRPLDLQEVPEDSVLMKLPHTEQSVSPVLDLPAQAPPKLLKNLRLADKRLAAEGRIEYLDQTTASVDNLLAHLFRLHELRWRYRGESGVLADAAIQDFHRRAAAGLAEAGLLRMYALAVDSRVIAISYGFRSAGHGLFYLGGFDPAWERFSPGALVLRHAIREAGHEGCGKFDFLRGGEGYKYRWGARDRKQYRIRAD